MGRGKRGVGIGRGKRERGGCEVGGNLRTKEGDYKGVLQASYNCS